MRYKYPERSDRNRVLTPDDVRVGDVVFWYSKDFPFTQDELDQRIIGGVNCGVVTTVHPDCVEGEDFKNGDWFFVNYAGRDVIYRVDPENIAAYESTLFGPDSLSMPIRHIWITETSWVDILDAARGEHRRQQR